MYRGDPAFVSTAGTSSARPSLPHHSSPLVLTNITSHRPLPHRRKRSLSRQPNFFLVSENGRRRTDGRTHKGRIKGSEEKRPASLSALCPPVAHCSPVRCLRLSHAPSLSLSQRRNSSRESQHVEQQRRRRPGLDAASVFVDVIDEQQQPSSETRAAATVSAFQARCDRRSVDGACSVVFLARPDYRRDRCRPRLFSSFVSVTLLDDTPISSSSSRDSTKGDNATKCSRDGGRR